MKQHMRRMTLLFLIGLMGFVLQQCGGGKTVVIYGKLIDASGGTIPAASISGAAVSLGDESTTINESQFFTFTSAKAGKTSLLKATVEGYAQGSRSVTAPDEGSMYVELTLLKWDGQAEFKADTGGKVTSASGAEVTFSGDSLDTSGTVKAKIAYLNPSIPASRATFPGNFLTDDGQLLESFGAVAIQVEDAAGEIVNLKNNQTASLTDMPVNGSSAASIPLWSYNETDGQWTQEGALTCGAGVCGGSLPHLSWWNADIVMETTCVIICPKDSQDAAVPGVQIEASGVDYNGISYGITGSDGCACLDVRKSSLVTITGVTSGTDTPTGNITTPDTVASCSQNDCTTLTDELVLERPRFQAILSWGELPTDLDSHFTGPCSADWTTASCANDRFEIYWSYKGSLNAEPFAFLDTDDTTSFGPEITSLTQCLAGVYRYTIHNFSGTPGMETSGASVLVILPDGSTKTYNIPTSNPDAALVWIVGDLTCDSSCDCSWKEVNAYGTTNDYSPSS